MTINPNYKPKKLVLPTYGPTQWLTNDPLSQALGGQAGDLGGGSGLAALIGLGGMDMGGSYGEGGMPGGFLDLENTTSTTGYDITGTGTGPTPMDVTELEDPYWEEPEDISRIIYDPPPPPYDPPYDPPSYDPPVDIRGTSIETGSFTPPGSGMPGSPGFAFNFPMPAIDPLGGAPGMGPVGFYSVNSGAAGLPVPAFGGLENPNMLSNYVQQFVGGPDVLTRALS